MSNYELAAWIRDNLVYDKLILECYRPGEPSSGWVYFSLKGEGRKQTAVVATYSGGQFVPGLIG